ncbi:TPA: replication initiator protein A [Staphylococcus aureus]|nr:replication initiator protein A [Staphylococcus aureus]EHS25232.1 replication initiator protein A, N-terminal domain protein [Staphylococcus aureus subsp. aureus IS-88]HAU5912635.1 replication initiator protein A [Staphylococcus aureus]HAU5936528.1 replication initiator protein A [Staphylococcus aureus]HAU5952351.1 replication initiator protein A [Staphylococcus aureus]HDA1033557.1 replication initiator protein A [Staphylococcus aureus]
MSNKFYIQETYRERFYQLPKVFFTNPNYTKLSNDAKIAYAILRDRLELSIKNNWVDDDNAIYFIFSNENLENILNVSKPKVIKIKKELENLNLLEQKRLGLNKPNKLYLMKPIVTNSDIYQIKNEENLSETSNDKEVKNINFQKLTNLTSRSKNNELQEVNEFNSNETDFSETDFSETDFSDTHYMNDNVTNLNHTDHANHDNKIFEEESLKDLEIQEFPKLTKYYLKNFSLNDVYIIKSVILKAKKSFNNRTETHYMLEDIDYELVEILKRFKAISIKKNETVKNLESYLMKSILSELEELHSLKLRQQNFDEEKFIFPRM